MGQTTQVSQKFVIFEFPSTFVPCVEALLNHHFASVHEKIRNEYCDLCGKVFAFNSLNNHKKICQITTKDFKCQFCERKFKTQSLCDNHAKRIHKEAEIIKCHHCIRSFKEKSVFERHLKVVHEGIKTNQCEFCNKSFGQHCNLKRHINQTHIKVQTQPDVKLEPDQNHADISK